MNEEEKYDGYYAIVTSELDKTDDEIIIFTGNCGELKKHLKLQKVN